MSRHGQLDAMLENFEGLRSDYSAAKQGRFRRRRTGLSPTGSGSDYHIRSEADYLRILEIARDIDRNDIVVGQGINRLVDNVVQEGIRLDPQTGNPKLNAELLRRWEDWGSDPELCHVGGEFDLLTIQRLVLRHTVVDGDVIVLPLASGAVQLVEAHRLRTPRGTSRKVVHGVRLDEDRRRIEYWLTKDDIDPYRAVDKVSDITRYPARDAQGNKQVLHLYFPHRASQTRGVSALASAIDAIGMHDDIQFAHLVKAQANACFTIFRQREPDYDAGDDQPLGETQTTLLSDGSTRRIEGLGPGLLLTGNPGEKLEGFSPNIPNAEFFPHAKMILRFVAITVGIPLEVLLLDASESNFSAWRASIDQARLGLKEKQRWLSVNLLRPLYLWKLRGWLAKDPALRAAAEANQNFTRHKWTPPTWQYMEPLKDAQADSHRLEKRLISPSELHNERGRDWDKVLVDIVEDNGKLIRRAKDEAQEINAEFGEDPVTWRDLVGGEAKPAAPAPPPQEAEADETAAAPKGPKIAT